MVFGVALNRYKSKLVISLVITVIDDKFKFSFWYIKVSAGMHTMLFIYVTHYLSKNKTGLNNFSVWGFIWFQVKHGDSLKHLGLTCK